MAFYTIKVDDEVMEYLKKHAIPFEDTPNAVIRRLLGLDRERVEEQKEIADLKLNTRLPAALEQILEVYSYYKKYGEDRIIATKVVARQRNIFPQTVMDKYARQLGKSAYDIDRLMRPENADEFKALLENKFPRYKKEIGTFFGKL